MARRARRRTSAAGALLLAGDLGHELRDVLGVDALDHVRRHRAFAQARLLAARRRVLAGSRTGSCAARAAGWAGSRRGWAPPCRPALAAASVWQSPQRSPKISRPCFSAAVSLIPPTWPLALLWLPIRNSAGRTRAKGDVDDHEHPGHRAPAGRVSRGAPGVSSAAPGPPRIPRKNTKKPSTTQKAANSRTASTERHLTALTRRTDHSVRSLDGAGSSPPPGCEAQHRRRDRAEVLPRRRQILPPQPRDAPAGRLCRACSASPRRTCSSSIEKSLISATM